MKDQEKQSSARAISYRTVLRWCDKMDYVIVESSGDTTLQNFTDNRQEGSRSLIFNGFF